MPRSSEKDMIEVNSVRVDYRGAEALVEPTAREPEEENVTAPYPSGVEDMDITIDQELSAMRSETKEVDPFEEERREQLRSLMPTSLMGRRNVSTRVGARQLVRGAITTPAPVPKPAPVPAPAPVLGAKMNQPDRKDEATGSSSLSHEYDAFMAEMKDLGAL